MDAGISSNMPQLGGASKGWVGGAAVCVHFHGAPPRPMWIYPNSFKHGTIGS
jgi:hypothetical protein